jgi:hypothetical protein
MDANNMQKVVELGLNASKIAANLSEAAKRDKQAPKPDNRPPKETTNQPHTQTVEVKVGDGGNNPPKVIKEKSETHIHKHYPDGREMSKDECDLERYRLDLEYRDKEAERQFRLLMEEHRRADQKERDDYARKMEEERKAEQKKTRRRNVIIGGILAGLGVGLTGYSVYTDFRNSQRDRLALPTQKAAPKKLIKGEGSVK